MIDNYIVRDISGDISLSCHMKGRHFRKLQRKLEEEVLCCGQPNSDATKDLEEDHDSSEPDRETWAKLPTQVNGCVTESRDPIAEYLAHFDCSHDSDPTLSSGFGEHVMFVKTECDGDSLGFPQAPMRIRRPLSTTPKPVDPQEKEPHGTTVTRSRETGTIKGINFKGATQNYSTFDNPIDLTGQTDDEHSVHTEDHSDDTEDSDRVTQHGTENIENTSDEGGSGQRPARPRGQCKDNHCLGQVRPNEGSCILLQSAFSCPSASSLLPSTVHVNFISKVYH